MTKLTEPSETPDANWVERNTNENNITFLLGIEAQGFGLSEEEAFVAFGRDLMKKLKQYEGQILFLRTAPTHKQEYQWDTRETHHLVRARIGYVI